MSGKYEIVISRDFSPTPTARYRSDGKFSGEEFRDDILDKLYREAVDTNNVLLIDLDGGYGYATSFLEEAFGGLARIYGSEAVLNRLEFKSDDEPELISDIEEYIKDAEKTK